MRTIFNDVLHVSTANPSSGIAVNRLLNLRDFPRREWHQEDGLAQVDATTGRSNQGCNEHGFIEGTLRRIMMHAASDAPAAALFQGEVIYVNQCSARALGIEDALTWPAKGDSEFFLPFDVAAFRKQSPDHPVAKLRLSGLLTDFAFLHRYPYTVGNAHRSRAQLILKHFLGVDVAALPLPPAGERELSQRPTLDDDRCVSCHKILDPVANLFHNFSGRDPTRRPRGPLAELWPRGLLGQAYDLEDAASPAPSTGGPATLSAEPLEWLGQRLGELPQFHESMVTLVWRGLTGQDFTPGPAVRAELAQRWRTGDGGPSLRSLAVMLSELPDFHVRDALGATSEDLAKRGFAPQQFAAVGELQDRLLQALGLEADPQGPLATALRRDVTDLTVPLGGIDHLQVTTRLQDPSPVWAASMQWLAARWSCVFADRVTATTTVDTAQPGTENTKGKGTQGPDSERLDAAYRSSFGPALRQLFLAATGRQPSPQEQDVLALLYRTTTAQTQAQAQPQELGARCPVDGAADPAGLTPGQRLARPGVMAAALFILLHDEVALR
jgi:hypothetical protein